MPVFTEARAGSSAHCRDSPEMARTTATVKPKIGSLQAGTIGAGNLVGANQSCASLFDRKRKNWAFKSTLGGTFRHIYSTLLRSVGTEFKVMQELLRHSSLRSTLDVYTQVITPSKEAAQEAVMFSAVHNGKHNVTDT